jgi:hypothetical protein
MISNLTPIIAVLTFVIPVLIFILLLPAIHELKKIKHEYPRITMGDTPEMQFQITHIAQLVNIEDEQKIDSPITDRLANVMAVLPNLEA